MTIFVYAGIFLGSLVAAYAVFLLVMALWPGVSAPAQPLGGAGRQGDGAEDGGSRKDVSFEVDGSTVRGWLYLPERGSHPPPAPCVVMAHGLGGTKATGLDGYARRFRGAGFAVLAFDYRHLGESDGEPRQLVWIPSQLADYAAAIAFVRGLEEVDPSRIALWGTSLSGGHVVVTAARDHDIACISAQVPLLAGDAGGWELVRKMGFGYLLRLAFGHGIRDMVRSLLGLSPHKIPLVGEPGTIAVMADREAWDFFEAAAPEGFVNEACARILIRMDKYHPIHHAKKVRCPVLIQACEKDIALPSRLVDEAESTLGDLAEVIRYPLGHFDIYQGEAFEEAVSDQVAFFRKHLRKD